MILACLPGASLRDDTVLSCVLAPLDSIRGNPLWLRQGSGLSHGLMGLRCSWTGRLSLPVPQFMDIVAALSPV